MTKTLEHVVLTRVLDGDGKSLTLLTPSEVSELVFEMLLVRAIDPAIARERANNIATALTGVVVDY